MAKLSAPWNSDQVAAINAFQKRDDVHPFTCPNHSDSALRVTPAALYCPVKGCSYTQYWVHDWMAGEKR